MKTEERILQATVRLVLAYGYDKTALEEIAREAGVARSTIYTKWKTKAELFAALLRKEAVKFAQDWYRLVEQDPEGGSFTGIYKNSLLAIRNNRFVKALYTQNRRVLGSFVTGEQLSGLMEERLAWTRKLFEMMQAEGLLRADVDAKTAAQMAVIFRQGLLFAELESEEPAAAYEAVIDLFVAMFRNFVTEVGAPEHQAAGKQMLKTYVEQLCAQYGEAEARASESTA
ncbi:MAG TPA: TetR/AcrR family transcriptional regulator [Anaerolineaceae bacterium]|nr:TetR/AcrR family transcriptional regulator [Anaerolineaceae bacterium]